jgi:hypothetical protein
MDLGACLRCVKRVRYVWLSERGGKAVVPVSHALCTAAAGNHVFVPVYMPSLTAELYILCCSSIQSDFAHHRSLPH